MEAFLHTVHGVLVQTAAIGTTRLTSNALKRAIHRDEPGAPPGEADGDAFPSNHATGPFAQAALVRENMQQTRLARPLATLYTGAAYVAASGAAWGRIEAGGHYVSDQLLGAALGNFVAPSSTTPSWAAAIACASEPATAAACSHTGPCVFNPARHSQGGGGGTNTPDSISRFWVYRIRTMSY